MHIYLRNARGREVTPRLRDWTCKMESSDIAKCKGGDRVLAHTRRVEEAVGRLRDDDGGSETAAMALNGPRRSSTVNGPAYTYHIRTYHNRNKRGANPRYLTFEQTLTNPNIHILLCLTFCLFSKSYFA